MTSDYLKESLLPLRKKHTIRPDISIQNKITGVNPT